VNLYRAKKDVRLYHPHFIIWKEGSILESESDPIIADEFGTIVTNKEEYRKYVEVFEE